MIEQTCKRFCSVAISGCVWLVLTLSSAIPPSAIAQDEPPAVIKLTADGIDAASRTDLKFSDPIDTRLTARDNFELSATYYPGIYGRNTPVLILLHDVLGSRADLLDLAAYLQSTYGFAVIVPDLRGHGESRKTGARDIDPQKLNRAEFEAFMMDIEACKRYLITRNDMDELNIDLLTVVAVGKTCVPAVNWSLADWSFPQLAGLRQGQDVKALVLISPEQGFKGVRMTNALKSGLFTGKDVPQPLRVLLAVGSGNAELVKEIDTIRQIVEKNRKLVENAYDGLFVFDDYTTNGVALTKADGGDLRTMIGQLVFFELFEKSGQYPWQTRGKK
jgi:pimeloyl-ACP methyl ester carboxylesterase